MKRQRIDTSLPKCQRFSPNSLVGILERMLIRNILSKKKILKKSASHLISDNPIFNKEICLLEFHVLKDLFWRPRNQTLKKETFKQTFPNILTLKIRQFLSRYSSNGIIKQTKIRLLEEIFLRIFLNPMIHKKYF